MFNYKIGIFISIVIFSIILALSYYFLYKESYNTVQIKSGAYGDLYGKSNPEGDYSFKEDPVRGIRKDYIKREGTNTGALLIKESYYSSPKKKGNDPIGTKKRIKERKLGYFRTIRNKIINEKVYNDYIEEQRDNMRARYNKAKYNMNNMGMITGGKIVDFTKHDYYPPMEMKADLGLLDMSYRHGK